MDVSQRIAEVEQQLIDQKAANARGAARERGLEAELEALQLGEREVDLAEVPRTEAIVEVVRAAGVPLSPTDIQERLHASGRTDTYHLVNGTIGYLVNKTKQPIKRHSHGLYVVS